MDNNSKMEKEKKLTIKELILEFKKTLKEVSVFLSKKDFKSILMFLGEVLVIIFLLCLIKIPFSLVRDFIINFLLSVEIQGKGIMNLLYGVFSIPYYLIVIYLFIKIFVKRYANINNSDIKEQSEVKDA